MKYSVILFYLGILISIVGWWNEGIFFDSIILVGIAIIGIVRVYEIAILEQEIEDLKNDS